jgi:RHS repeat-associated protein
VRHHFTGKERDVETNSDYFGERYYASTQGRFMSVDIEGPEISNPQTMNKYRYALNNPLRYIDPNGAYEIDVHFFLTRALAYAAGFSLGQANTIANADQGLDKPGSSTDPLPLSHVDARADWHFTSTQRRAQLWKEFSDDATQGFFNSSLEALGRYLHTWQDYYSHGDRPAETGQLQDCPNIFNGSCWAPTKHIEMCPKLTIWRKQLLIS